MPPKPRVVRGQATQDIFRLDLASNKWEKFHPTDQLPAVKNAGIYQVMADSKNNLWMAEFTEAISARSMRGRRK